MTAIFWEFDRKINKNRETKGVLESVTERQNLLERHGRITLESCITCAVVSLPYLTSHAFPPVLGVSVKCV